MEALAREGPAAMAVEPLAARLGVTKGSFYWHFGNRRDLVSAVAEEWERRGADEPVAALSAEGDPVRRIERLFEIAWDTPEHLRAERALLGAAVGDAKLAAVAARVHAKRRRFLVTCYRALGLGAAEADRWAATAHAVYMGAVQLSDAPPFDRARTLRAWVRHAAGRLLPPAAADPPPRRVSRHA